MLRGTGTTGFDLTGETLVVAGAVVGLAGEKPNDGCELGQPALLAADPEHLDSVRPRGVAAGEQAPPLARPLGGGLRLRQAAVAERERARVVLCDVEVERLADALCDHEELRERVAGGVVVAEHDVRRDEPCDRLARDEVVVELVADRSGFDEHPVDGLVHARPARPVRRREERPERPPVAAPA